MPDAVLTRGDVERLAWELAATAKPGHRAEVMRLVDRWLDEHLEEIGAHPADCDCDDCARVVADALARRLGECTDERDVASVAEWGGLMSGDNTG